MNKDKHELSCSADFQVCCIAGFQTRAPLDLPCHADLEIVSLKFHWCLKFGISLELGGWNLELQFGFSPQGERVYLDNVVVTPN